jgi:hypothetical protein
MWLDLLFHRGLVNENEHFFHSCARIPEYKDHSLPDLGPGNSYRTITDFTRAPILAV